MDRQQNQPRNGITLSHPTPIIVAALRAKNQTWDTNDKRSALKEITGPALVFRDTIVIGEASILGWIDRRYPLPSLFPSELDLYAKASTIAYALEQAPEQAPTLWAAMKHKTHLTAFLLGNMPTIADLALWGALQKTDADAADAFEARLFTDPVAEL
jgi:glutathione S-transferase